MNIKHVQKSAKPVFIDEDEIRQVLIDMETNLGLKTEAGVNLDDSPVSFQEKHLAYLRTHPKLNPEHYLANLRTMLKIRR